MTGWVYIIGLGEGQPFKVGRTYSVENRLNNLQSGNHLELVVHVAIETADPVGVEYMIASEFEEQAIRGEWYEWSDNAAALIAKLASGCGRTLRRYQATGHIRLPDRYDKSAVPRMQENARKKVLRARLTQSLTDKDLAR